jgi:hypothetical protein
MGDRFGALPKDANAITKKKTVPAIASTIRTSAPPPPPPRWWWHATVSIGRSKGVHMPFTDPSTLVFSPAEIERVWLTKKKTVPAIASTIRTSAPPPPPPRWWWSYRDEEIKGEERQAGRDEN